MRSILAGALGVAAIAATLVLFGGPSAAAPATHASHPSPTPAPPVIERQSVRPLCSALVHHIAPVIGMMDQNDRTIGRSPSLFDRYNRDVADASQYGDATNAERQMTLEHLESLVGPLANNVIAMQRELENPQVFPPNPQTAEERMLDEMRNELLKALAAQAVTLDIINGYVQTQRLADMQHEGLQGSDISAIQGSDLTSAPQTPAPDPLLQDPNAAGIPQNPYSIDPLDIPGITGSVGTTPLSRLIAALRWLQQETTRRENVASTTVISVAGICRRAEATPAPH